MNIFRNIVKPVIRAVIGGVFLAWASHKIGSTFLIYFLRANLLLLLPALMAINVTTAGVIMTKLKDLSDKHKADFTTTIHNMKVSFYEQTALMLIAAILLITDGAHKLGNLQDTGIMGHDIKLGIESLICASFLYALFILHDTASGIFVILNWENPKELE